MTQTVLGSITLSYRPLWGRARNLSGFQLRVGGEPGAYVDAPHLLRTLDEMWTADAPPLLLSPDSPELLAALLHQAPDTAPSIEVRDDWLDNPQLLHEIMGAKRRGVRLVWRGDVRHIPPPALAQCFSRYLLSLRPEDAAAALQATLLQRRHPGMAASGGARSPVLAGHYYEGIASGTLADHCLDQKQATALVGWPDDEVLQGHQLHALTPSHDVVDRLLRAIRQDRSMDVIEEILGEDPILAYRFLTLTNSAALGLRTGIDSLRRGLMMMGYSSLESWLRGQFHAANNDPNLSPVRQAVVLRATLMQYLIDAGIENDLRREVYLCGLFSQLDALMGEPLAAILGRLPLSDRIVSATLSRSGPYAAALDLACAMGGEDLSQVRQLRHAHELDTEETNRALLHMLRNQHVGPSARA